MKYKHTFIFIIIFSIFVFAVFDRLKYFDQVGKDIYAYEKAVVDLLGGRNPYIWTVQSFSNPDDTGNHGYSYLPLGIYLFSFLYMINLITDIEVQFLWKIPVLLADLGVGVLLVQYFIKKDIKIMLLSLIIWLFNPYMVFRGSYTFIDPLAVFFMMLSLYYLEKDSVLSGTFITLGVAFKTFPILIFPLLLLKTPDRKKFLLSCSITGIAIAAPFLRSLDDFLTMLRGSVFVHSVRELQGRPFLFYISYYLHIEFFQVIPLKVYSLIASLGGWIVAVLLYIRNKNLNIYILGVIPFLIFYLFTPVLNRTYLIWFIPIFCIAAYNPSLKSRNNLLFYIFIISFYIFYSWYLIQWEDGFHVWRPI